MGSKQDRTGALVRKLGNLLTEIPKDATVERVHHLRTTVRRLETVHDTLPETEASEPKVWKRLSKIRRRAGKV
ncbi:MAG: hypothetical protein AB7O65_09350, partial [Candidatus Korobacteraceae bacterium]